MAFRMKNIILVIAIFITTSVLSQSTDSIKLKNFKVGVLFSPDYCYRLLNYHPSYEWVEDMRNTEEVAIFGYTTGLDIRMDLTNKIVLETGLFYSIKGEQTKYTELLWTTPNPDYAVKSKTKHLFKYIDIPLKVHYLFGTKNIKWFVSTGIALNVFSERKTQIISEFSDGQKASDNSAVDLGYLKFNLSAIVGFGINYDLTKRISVSVEPVYRQFINSIVADIKAKENPYSFGANVGIYYTLKKRSKDKE